MSANKEIYGWVEGLRPKVVTTRNFNQKLLTIDRSTREKRRIPIILSMSSQRISASLSNKVPTIKNE